MTSYDDLKATGYNPNDELLDSNLPTSTEWFYARLAEKDSEIERLMDKMTLQGHLMDAMQEHPMSIEIRRLEMELESAKIDRGCAVAEIKRLQSLIPLAFAKGIETARDCDSLRNSGWALRKFQEENGLA